MREFMAVVGENRAVKIADPKTQLRKCEYTEGRLMDFLRNFAASIQDHRGCDGTGIRYVESGWSNGWVFCKCRNVPAEWKDECLVYLHPDLKDEIVKQAHTPRGIDFDWLNLQVALGNDRY
jgi:hypothetical protein